MSLSAPYRRGTLQNFFAEYLGKVAFRRDRRLAFPAVSTATLLFADAWSDVCTAPAGRPLAWAIAGVGVEVAEAAACLALAFAVWHDASRSAGLVPATTLPAVVRRIFIVPHIVR